MLVVSTTFNKQHFVDFEPLKLNVLPRYSFKLFFMHARLHSVWRCLKFCLDLICVKLLVRRGEGRRGGEGGGENKGEGEGAGKRATRGGGGGVE